MFSYGYNHYQQHILKQCFPGAQMYRWCPRLCFLMSLCYVHGQGFVVEVQLDSAKQNQKESIRRTLFLESQQASLVKSFNLAKGDSLCQESKVYLRVSKPLSNLYSIPPEPLCFSSRNFALKGPVLYSPCSTSKGINWCLVHSLQRFS